MLILTYPLILLAKTGWRAIAELKNSLTVEFYVDFQRLLNFIDAELDWCTGLGSAPTYAGRETNEFL